MPDPIHPETNRITRCIVDSAFQVHSRLGPGLLESVYGVCLAHEMGKAGLTFRHEVGVPVVYDDIRFDAGFRLDFLVEEKVVVEIKAVDAIHPVHEAQLLTYLKLSDRRVGLLINFNVPVLKSGIRRMVL
jgi:GxxExxY protein